MTNHYHQTPIFKYRACPERILLHWSMFSNGVPWLPSLGVGGKRDLKTPTYCATPFHLPVSLSSPGKVGQPIFCPSASAPPPGGPTHAHDLAILGLCQFCEEMDRRQLSSQAT